MNMGMSVTVWTEMLCTLENGNEEPKPHETGEPLAADSAKSLFVQSFFVLGIGGRQRKFQRLVETHEVPEVKARNCY